MNEDYMFSDFSKFLFLNRNVNFKYCLLNWTHKILKNDICQICPLNHPLKEDIQI
jgi:hypothetical protein